MRLRSKLWALSALVLLAPVLAEELRLAVSRGPVAPAQQILKTRLPGDAGSENLSEHDFRLVLEQSLITTMDGQARRAKSQGPAPPGASPGNLLRSIAPSPLRKAVPGSVSLVQ